MTTEEERFIIEHWNEMSVEKLRKLFNETFGADYKTTAFHYHTKRLGLKKMDVHKYTKEEDDFLRANSPKMTREELTFMFNEKFHCNIDSQAITVRCWKYGYQAQSDGQFKKGSVPWEKTKGGRDEYMKKYKAAPHYGWEKGHKPHNIKELGSERVMKDDGKIYVKTESGWIPKTEMVWREFNGDIPKGYRILSVNGAKNDTDIKNLRMIDNATQTILVANRWHDKGAEIFDVGVQYAKLYFTLKEQMGLNHYDFRNRFKAYTKGELT